MADHKPFPPWIRKGLATGAQYHKTELLLASHEVDTICTEAKCPNQGECWAKGTATVLILGHTCTLGFAWCPASPRSFRAGASRRTVQGPRYQVSGAYQCRPG